MKTKVIKEYRTLSSNTLRAICVSHNFCTLATNSQYDILLAEAGSLENIDAPALYHIALNIMVMSDKDSLEATGVYDTADMMFILCLRCISRFKVEEDDEADSDGGR